jgi:hypothetical protein
MAQGIGPEFKPQLKKNLFILNITQTLKAETLDFIVCCKRSFYGSRAELE